MPAPTRLIAMSARRALTFLEAQPVVAADKLGVEGHSMGGRSTVLTAIDPRVKAASPSVGGSGYLHTDIWGLPKSGRHMPEVDGLSLYQSGFGPVLLGAHYGSYLIPRRDQRF